MWDRQGKRKCRQNPGDSACLRCQSHSLHCSFASSHPATPNNATLPPLSRSSFSESVAVLTPVSLSCNPHSPTLQFSGQLSSPLLAGEASLVSGLSAFEVQETVKWYFKVIHDTHHSLFHRPTFEHDLKNGRVSPVIIHAIVALGSRCVTCG